MNTKRRSDCQLWHDWKERIIRIGDEQTSLQNQFDNLRNEFTDNSPRIEALEADVNSLDGRLIIAESDIADAEDRITACEADIDRIDAELVNKTGEINNLANRVTLAEADIDDIDARLDGIEAGEILLSKLVPDADKDMGGKTLSNVRIDANSLTVKGCEVDPTRRNDDGLIWDGQNGFACQNLALYRPQQYPAEYIDVIDGPNPIALSRTGEFGIGHSSNPEKMVRVSPGDSITLKATCRTTIDSPINGGVLLIIQPYDKDMNFVSGVRPSLTHETLNDGIWREYELSWIVPDGIYYVSPYVYFNEKRQDATTQICDLKIYKDFNRNIAAKNIAADAVIIKDGGTVDGVDISTHNHDGTAVGGPKISLSNIDGDNNPKEVRLQNFIWKAVSPAAMKSPKEYNSPGGNIFFENYQRDIINPDFPYVLNPTITIGDGPTGTGFRRQIVFSQSQMYLRTGHTNDTDWLYPWRKFVFSDMNDVVSLSGLNITDGGTVDGVDISTHTHDGTAIGGPKISYNDLVDKPDIPTSLPKPPMPYKKTVSINLGSSIHVLDIIPEGRTALTVEQLQYREIANIDEGAGQFVDIGIRYDDNTIYSGIDRITKNGDTDWHPPTYPSFNPVYHFTKNYIIGIRITRSPHEGPNITGYVDIIGHVY